MGKQPQLHHFQQRPQWPAFRLAEPTRRSLVARAAYAANKEEAAAVPQVGLYNHPLVAILC
jgi:hypothetical protein